MLEHTPRGCPPPSPAVRQPSWGGFLSQPHFPPQLTFSTLLLPLVAPDCLKARSSSAESRSILCLPPSFGKSESIPTHASIPHACSQAGANRSTPYILTQAQQVPRCANTSLTHSLALINAKIWKNGQAQSYPPLHPLNFVLLASISRAPRDGILLLRFE